jgi:alkanesulfonate monooxygenase SsuD/methylene tetrahydromethanopterin reductase-like flavin-dependent oxidoreductase (luciferase family)
MNRHPAVLARMAASLQAACAGRLILGLGVGAETGEHTALGMEYPRITERAARLEEAVAMMRALWSGEPATRESRFYPLNGAVALPVPQPRPPVVIAGESPAGARLAARVGDGWTTSDTNFERLLPAYLGALAEAGRRREPQLVLVEVNEGDWLADVSLKRSEWVLQPRKAWQRWREAGADGAVIQARSRADVDALVTAVERW